jgi:glycosyltransferase involved in cell wall biosynthesis
MSAPAQNLDRLAVTIVHHRYRAVGGEERCVDQLADLARAAGGDVALIERSSTDLGGAGGSARAAAALLIGGSPPSDAHARAVGRHVVHAHNLHPTFGWRTLARLRASGAAIVLHLHNYRLFCAIGTALRDGADCFDCAPRATWHGVRHRCRGTASEAIAYGAGIGLWQRRLLAQADAVVAPCRALLDDLAVHGVIEGGEVVANWLPVDSFASVSRAGAGEYALMATRVSPEKGVDVAVRACAAAGVPLKVAGDGPALGAARSLAGELRAEVEFVGQLGPEPLARLRERAAFALLPSTWREVQPFAALESLAAGLPVLASDTPALAELTAPDLLFDRGDHATLAATMRRLLDDRAALQAAGDAALERAHANHSEVAARASLEHVYESALAQRAASQSTMRRPIGSP